MPAPEKKWDQAALQRLKRDSNGEALLTIELIEAFESLLLEGNTRANVSRVVGLQRTTLNKWMKLGLSDVESSRTTLYSRLVWTIDRCEGEQERVLVQSAFRSAKNDGGLALKLLERRNPDDWAPAVADTTGAEPKYGALSKQALREEARKVLKAAVKEGEVEAEVVVSPKEG